MPTGRRLIIAVTNQYEWLNMSANNQTVLVSWGADNEDDGVIIDHVRSDEKGLIERMRICCNVHVIIDRPRAGIKYIVAEMKQSVIDTLRKNRDAGMSAVDAWEFTGD